jgi:hypothetical protein
MGIGISIGLGLSILFFFLRYLVPAMPKYVSWPGMAIGVGVIIWSMVPPAFPLSNSTFPGLSTTMGLKINDASKLGRQYVFEYSTPEGAKTALYLLDTNRFTFVVTDVHGESYSLEIPIGDAGIPIANLYF